MALVFQNDVLFEGNNIIEVQLQGITTDATNQTTPVKAIDISTLKGPNYGGAASDAAPPSKLSLLEVTWDVQGFTSVILSWDASTDDEIVTMFGQGYMTFWPIGGKHDPQSTTFTGDIMVSTISADTNSNYNVRAVFRKKQ